MKYIIIGNGSYAIMLKKYIYNTEGKNIDAFSVPSKFITKPYLDRVPVIAAENIGDIIPPEDCMLLMGIGYSKMNTIKQQEFIRYESKGYKFANYVHPTAIIENDVQMGRGNNIFEGVILQSGVKIGDGNLIYGGAMVAHETVMGDFNSLSVKTCVAGCVNIGNNCFFGANATVRDHLNISDFTLLGAGAYLSKETQQFDVIVAPRALVLDNKKSIEFI